MGSPTPRDKLPSFGAGFIRADDVRAATMNEWDVGRGTAAGEWCRG